MHVIDGGSDVHEPGVQYCRFKCRRCEVETDWEETPSITAARRGIPCHNCNPKEITIMKYRKKPLTIEAYQWFKSMGASPGVRFVPAHNVDLTKKDAAGKEIGRGIIHEAPESYVCDTLEGPLQVSEGDYIITGIKGEVYPCKPDIFERSYDNVDAEAEEAAAKEANPLLSVGNGFNEEKLVQLLQKCSVWGKMIKDEKVYNSKNFLLRVVDLTDMANDILLEKEKADAVQTN